VPSFAILRHFSVHKARREHFCDRCCYYISVGDSYTAYVWATGTTVFTMKEHSDPPCPVDPLEEERKMREEWEREDAEKLDQAA
jgi:hypothetical protein